jgi:hypothetical protein
MREFRDEGRQRRSRDDEDDREKRLLWIAPLNIQSYTPYRDARSKVHPVTGKWLFREGEEHLLWKDGEDVGPVFCLRGAGGSGKTVLSSLVLRGLRKQSPLTAGARCVFYYYFDYRDTPRNKATCLTDCLFRQVLLYDSPADDDVKALQ